MGCDLDGSGDLYRYCRTQPHKERSHGGIKGFFLRDDLALLILIMGLVGCNGETVNIDFPFEVGDVENIEMYHYAGVPVSAEKKVVVAESDITGLYDMFEDLSLKDKQVEETTGADVTSFRFNLSDGTNYELIYVCNGVKNGKLKSSTGNFEYFTSSDIGSYWSNIDLEAVPVEESELPK